MLCNTDRLTPKQAQFVQEYIIDLNATAAAKRAGYSEKTAKSQGQRLLTKVDVQRAVQAAKDQRAKKTGIDTVYVVTNLKDIAEEAMGRADYSNAIRALDLLGRHTGAFEKDNKQKQAVIRIISNV